MKTRNAFPHDKTYADDYDAESVNGEIFNGNDDLAGLSRAAALQPSFTDQLESPFDLVNLMAARQFERELANRAAAPFSGNSAAVTTL